MTPELSWSPKTAVVELRKSQGVDDVHDDAYESEAVQRLLLVPVLAIFY
jgi:hypothetical protein